MYTFVSGAAPAYVHVGSWVEIVKGLEWFMIWVD